MERLYKHRFLFARRFTDLSMILLYGAANWWGLKVLQGNLASSSLFEKIPLSDPYAVIQMSAAGAILGVDALVGAAIIALFYAIIGGRAFCSYVCPINLVTDGANYLRRALRLDEAERKVWVSRNIRYWILALSILLSFALGAAAFEMISPIGVLNRGLIYGIGFGGAVIVGVFLFDLFALKNGFCGHICPLGAFYSLIGRFSLFRVRHDQQKCTLCMKCTTICPEKQVLSMIGKKSAFIDNTECTNCGRCVEVCDDDALGFGIRSFGIRHNKE